jgi:hypothetical protein
MLNLYNDYFHRDKIRDILFLSKFKDNDSESDISFRRKALVLFSRALKVVKFGTCSLSYVSNKGLMTI